MSVPISVSGPLLMYIKSFSRDGQKHRWLDQCVTELKDNDKWVIPALRQIKDICSLYHVSTVYDS